MNQKFNKNNHSTFTITSNNNNNNSTNLITNSTSTTNNHSTTTNNHSTTTNNHSTTTNNRFYITQKEYNQFIINGNNLKNYKFYPSLSPNQVISKLGNNKFTVYYGEKINKLNILYVNSNGFKNKKEVILNFLIYIYDIIFISETWFVEYCNESKD